MRAREVLYLLPRLHQGGTERQVTYLLTDLDRERYRPRLALFNNQDLFYGQLLERNMPIHYLSKYNEPWRNWLPFMKLIGQTGPAIIHTFLEGPNLMGQLARLYHRQPLLVTSVRNAYISPGKFLTHYAMRAMVESTVVNSVRTRRRLLARSRLAPHRVILIPTAVDTEVFRPPLPAERRAARRQFGIKPGEFVLTLPGRLVWEKDHLTLLRAVAGLKAESLEGGKLRILLPGRRESEKVAREVEAFIAEAGLGAQVEMRSPVKDMRSYYQAVDLLVLPSKVEGMSNVLLEAMASALPVIVSEGADADQVVCQGVEGFRFPTGDSQALADAIRLMLFQGGLKRALLGKRARDRMLADFSREKLAGSTMALYDRLLEKVKER